MTFWRCAMMLAAGLLFCGCSQPAASVKPRLETVKLPAGQKFGYKP